MEMKWCFLLPSFTTSRTHATTHLSIIRFGLSTYNFNLEKPGTSYGSSRPDVFFEKGVLRNFAKFTRKHLCQRLFFNKVAGLRPKACNFIKKESPAQVFSCEFCEISKNTIFNRTCHIVGHGRTCSTYHFVNDENHTQIVSLGEKNFNRMS